MNAGPDFSLWLQLFGTLGLEASLIFLLALGLHRCVRTAAWQRTVWHVGLVALGLIAVLEVTGGSRLLTGSAMSFLKSAKPAEPPATIIPMTAGLRLGPASPAQRAETEFGAPLRGQAVVAPQGQETAGSTINPATPLFAKSQGCFRWWPGLVWLAGFGLVGGWAALSRALFFLLRQRRQRGADPVLTERVQFLAGLLGIRRCVQVTCLPRLTGPIAYGILRPTISLPERFSSEFTPEQREAMLIHELAHLAAHDPLWYLLADVVAGLLWWHPLVWWSRRQFQAASETLADEASLLLENGPDALAESLVEMGKRLALPRSPAWLGVQGNGFRSGLGRRVERLILMTDHSWRPAHWLGSWLAKVAGPGMLIVAVLAGATWALPAGEAKTAVETWNHSVAGLTISVLQSASRAKGMEAAQPQNEAARPPLPDLDPIWPSHQVALVTAQAPEGAATTQPDQKPTVSAAPSGGTNPPSSRDKITSKLDQIRLNELRLDGLPLSEVVMLLADEARKGDTERTGINFMINAPAAPPEVADVGATTIRIMPALRNVTLHQTLDAVVQAAARPIKYSIEEYAVVFSLKAGENPALHTRIFHVDPNTFMHGLLGISTFDDSSFRSSNRVDGAHSSGFPGARTVGRKTNDTSQPIRRPSVGPEETELLELIRDFLRKAGVSLDPPKNIFFNDRTGMVMVRATLEDLDAVEKAIQVLNASPPQVVIEAKFCEIMEDDNPLSGFDWSLGSLLTTNSGTETTTAILSEQQFRAVVKALERKSGVELLTAPKVTTVSRRQAQIKVVDVKYVVTDLMVTTNSTRAAGSAVSTLMQPITEPVELGPVLDVVPHVSADGDTIQMTVIASIKEFLGYQNAEGFIAAVRETDAKKISKTPITSSTPMPNFRLRQVVTSAVVSDGQTLVLTGGTFVETVTKKAKVPVLGDLPLAGRLFRSESSVKRKKKLLIFVTPTVIDPAGNRLHAEAQTPPGSKAVPPQSVAPAKVSADPGP